MVETTEFEGDPFLSLLIRMINKVIGFSCIRFTAIIPACNLRNGPDKNDSNNGNEHVGMQKRC